MAGSDPTIAFPRLVSERIPAAPETAPRAAGNAGIELDIGWVSRVRVNLSAAERRVETLPKRRTVKKAWQAAWLLKAVTLMDLTTLSADDTAGRVVRLCAKARAPVRADLLEALGWDGRPLTTAAVCVYHEMVPAARAALAGTAIAIAAVSAGFPAGLSPLELRLEEIRRSVQAGATEIDVVISRRHVLTSDWRALYAEVRAFREACGPAHMKTILGTGQLGSIGKVAKAALVALMAGSDFIKTSTGMEPVNATLPVSLVMMRMLREFAERTGQRRGFKPAGGISSAKTALTYLMLVKEELGDEWLAPERFRFGASRLLGDIERQLEHQVTGRYSAAHRHPLS
ncbi:MAG TPA: deoxyribose-phosphate aldolase [Steroidobacteraceae bacterium]|nr:deoxyribose-phosphate aldolase [Steroidobacteraceae bacterium]